MEKFSTYFGLKLGHFIFPPLEQPSLTPQAKGTTIQEAIQCSNVTLQFMQKQRSDGGFDSFYHQVVDEGIDLTDPPALPRNRRHQANVFTSPEHYFVSCISRHWTQLLVNFTKDFSRIQGFLWLLLRRNSSCTLLNYL